MGEINKNNSVEISKKVIDLVSDGSLSVPESQELTDIFEKNKRNTIVISQEALRELRKTIGSSKTADYITDSEKEIIKNIKGTTTQYTY
jgi:predicted nucleic acid-binding protein